MEYLKRAHCCPSVYVPVLDGDKEKACLTECRKERDEVEAYCTSEFGKLCSPGTTQTQQRLLLFIRY